MWFNVTIIFCSVIQIYCVYELYRVFGQMADRIDSLERWALKQGEEK